MLRGRGDRCRGILSGEWRVRTDIDGDRWTDMEDVVESLGGLEPGPG